MANLDGKVAVITGASSGMALASAKLFVEEGAYVFITGRRLEKLNDPVSATVHKTQGKYVRHCRIKQTEFGTQPVTVGGGLIKVKNEFDIELAIAVAPSAAE